MTRPLTIMLCAGEPSGDALGADLMAELRVLRPGARLIGVGGPAMQAQGLVSFFGIGELAVMGIKEVVPKLRLLFRRMKQVADFALRTKPDVVVLIDSGDFNHRVARRIRAADPSIKLIKYVSPQIWASRPGRAEKMKAWLDHVLCLLPFEPPYYEKVGLPATFVGHPAVARASRAVGGDALRAGLGIAPDAKLLCVLPGSRRFEVRNLTPVFREAVAELKRSIPDLVCVLPTVPNVEAHVRRLTADWPAPLHILKGEADRFAAFDAADAALAASGTVTTELAVAGVPMVAAYDLGWLTTAIWRRMLTIRFMTIVNLVLDRPAIPEFVEARGEGKAIAAALLPLLTDAAAAAAQRADLAEAVQKLGSNENASRKAADVVLQIAEAAR
ncbi:Lipid-A-disaccharide synthase [Alphaproteobacteria bacterium SO-S41]|nr:Lipid-A-disaccharide synthase [Alphaproteobacteria bacterium SO-S41]